MDQVIPDIVYGSTLRDRNLGDLHLPSRHAHAPPAALVIHGGGWNAMDKHGLAGIAQQLAERGWAAYNINYRLLDHTPWPACGDDCLAAARYLLTGDHPAFQAIDRDRLLIVGASAGGHLAMMTGLRLARSQVRGIVSIAGPGDLPRRCEQPDQDKAAFARRFLGEHEPGERDALLRAASPLAHVSAGAPPLLCIHSRNDELVRPEQSELMIEAYRAAGAEAELFMYDGPGDSHGIWIEGTDPHRLLPEPAGALDDFAARMAAEPAA